MSTKKQMISQMLNDGTITGQESEYVIALLQENPKQDIGAAIEKAKERFSKGTQNDFYSDTLYLEELDDSYNTPSETTNSVENIQIDGLIEDFNESLQETIEFDELTDGFLEVSEGIHVAPLQSPTKDSLSRITPETISRYKTTSDSNLIGEGGMGRVIRVFDTHLGRNIARKELYHSVKRQNSSGGISIQQRFLREARITAQLEHPGIVPVYEVGENEDGTLYYTMQELTGRTLKDALQACTSLEERILLMEHIVDFCHAIGFAHSKGIIHRDIKTENVMIDAHGQTIVLDWGLAKSISESEDIDTEVVSNPMVSGKTRIGVVMGTPSYMSPEQALGSINELNEATDVWSLGIVLFEIITGQLPFSDSKPTTLLQKICTEVLPSPSDIEPKAPKSLCAIMEKSLQKSAKDRYQNAALLAKDLQAWQQGGRVSVYEYSWQDKFEKWFVNNRNVAFSSLLGIVLLMISIMVGTISIAQKQAEVELERDRAIEAEKTVRISRVRSKLQAIQSKINKLESDTSYAEAFALKRAYIDVKDKEFARLQIKDDHSHSVDKDIHHLFRLATKTIPSKLIPYDGGEVYTIATNSTSVVVGYSNMEIRSYSLDTGEVEWFHTVDGRPIEIRWLSDTQLLVLDMERSNDINIRLMTSPGAEQGMKYTVSVPFTNHDFDYSRLVVYHQKSNSLILYTDGKVISLQLDTGTRKEVFQVSHSDIGALALSRDQQYLAISHRSSITIIDVLNVDSNFSETFIHPDERPNDEFDSSMISDMLWVDGETLIFRDYSKIWKYSFKNREAVLMYKNEKRSDPQSQVWNLDGTDSIVTATSYQNDVFVRLNWKTLETSFFTKEKYNLPNRTQILSLESGRWWGYSKEEKIILKEVDGTSELSMNKFSSDIITLYHPGDGTLIAGNNTGELQIIDYSEHISPVYPFIFYAEQSNVSSINSPEKDFFRYGHIQNDWYYGTVPTHDGSTLHLLNTSTQEHRTVTFDEELFLCDVLEHSTDKTLGLSFSNPCDYEQGGGMVNKDNEFKFGVTHIPFPETSSERMDVELLEFKFELKGLVLQSQRTIIRDEKIYTDGECVHFVDLKEEQPNPLVRCVGEEGTPYNDVIHSPDGKKLAFYNKAGRIAIWNRETKHKESYTSLHILNQLHCDSAALVEQNQLLMLCSNTLYRFDLSKDELLQTIPFITDVTNLVTTSDGSVSLVTSKTRKRFWKISGQNEPEEYSLQNAETFQAISPNKRFAITNNGQVYHFETMTHIFSIGPLESINFSDDSNSVITKYSKQIRMLPLPDVSLELINQKDTQIHNLRVCYQSLDVVPVVPFPKDSSPWADPNLCVRDQ